MKKILIRVFVIAIVLAAAWGGYRYLPQISERQQQVATTRVRRGDVIVRTYARGELRAVRSVTLTAPNLFGTVQVTRLAPLGSFAREKDLVVEFDDAEVLSRLEEKQLELEQIDERIKKSEADLAIRNNQDQVDLLRSRYAVRRAELEVKRNELISAIDAKKNLLNLEEARRRLKQLESDIKSRLQQAEAEIAVLRETKNKSLLELQREQQRLRQVKLLAPMSGLVAIRQARSGYFFFSGMQLPDIREGDEVRPGSPVADVLDLSELELVARVGELDRANLHEGQDAVIRLDAIADKAVHGKIKALSGTASANIYSNDPAKKFDVVFSIDMRQLLSALGAKPGQIERVMATAEQNRKKPMATMVSRMRGGGGFGGMAAGGGFPGAAAGGGPGGPPGSMIQMRMGGPAEQAEGEPGGEGGQRAGTRRGGGSRAGGGRPQMSEEQRKKFQEALQKELKGRNMQDLSQEERQKIISKIRETVGVSSGSGRASGASAGEGSGRAARGEAGAGEERAGAAGQSRGGRRGGGAAGGEGLLTLGMGGAPKFTEKELAEAKLPPPPEEDSQLDVLLRPGLLADVEIIVEKIPNAIYVPVQAIFEKDAKPMVYVKTTKGFEERFVKPLKRSESTMIISEGLKPGETVALADPNAKPGAKKKEAPAGGGGGGGAMGGMPAGGRRGGR